MWFSEHLICSKQTKENFVCIQAYWPNRRGEIDTINITIYGLENWTSLNTNDGIKAVITAEVTWFEEYSKKNI